IAGIAAAGYQTVVASVNGAISSWGNNAQGQLGDGTTATRFVPTAVRNFRLTNDADHDGLAMADEVRLGSDPSLFSTVGDGISDGWKAMFNFSVSDAALASGDPFGKGMTLLQDYQLATNPPKVSSIDDGIADAWKVPYGW